MVGGGIAKAGNFTVNQYEKTDYAKKVFILNALFLRPNN